MATDVLASGRTIDQWQNCDPRAMAGMSEAAIIWALMDAKADILALASRIRSLEAAPQPVGAWRPIETAPRGEWLLAWRDHAFRPLIVKWDDQYGAFENEWGDHVYEVRHWQPLPAPPCALSNGGEG